MNDERYEVSDVFMMIVAKLLGVEGSWQSVPRSTSPAIMTLAADIDDMAGVPQFFADLNMTRPHAKEVTLRLHRFVARLYWDARALTHNYAAASANLTQPQILNAYHREIDRLWTMLQEKRHISVAHFTSDYADHFPHQIPSSAAWWIEDSEGARWLVLAGLATLARAMAQADVDTDVGPPSGSWHPDTPDINAAIEKRFREVSFATCYKAADVLEQHGERAYAEDVRARYDDLLRRRKEDYLRVSALLAPPGTPGSKRTEFLAQLAQDEQSGCLGSWRVREMQRGLHRGEPLRVYRAIEDHLDHVAERADTQLSLGYSNLCPSAKMLWTYDEWFLIVDHTKNYGETVGDVLRRYGWIR